MSITLLIGRPLIALACLAIGILSTLPLESSNSFDVPTLAPISTEESVSMVSVCDLGEPSGIFVGKRIAVKATVYHASWSNDEHSEDFVYVYPLPTTYCSSGYDPFITTELDFRKYSGPNANLKFELGPFEREVDVYILGTVRRAGRPNSLIQYKIEPDAIELISPWREFTPKGAA